MAATLADMTVAAMRAGLAGENMPNLGYLTAEQLSVVNAIYDAARNYGSAPVLQNHGA